MMTSGRLPGTIPTTFAIGSRPCGVTASNGNTRVSTPAPRPPVHLGAKGHLLEPGGAQHGRQAPAAVWLFVHVVHDAIEDAIGQRTIGMRERERAEVLILHGHAPARARDARHLARDQAGI